MFHLLNDPLDVEQQGHANLGDHAALGEKAQQVVSRDGREQHGVVLGTPGADGASAGAEDNKEDAVDAEFVDVDEKPKGS